MLQALLVAHIAVLGYWLGAELVINSTYRFVSRSANMPMPERDRLMDHVLNVDQHVRYALLFQLISGAILAAHYGRLPGGQNLVTMAWVFGVAWLALVEITHRRRKTAIGVVLARVDRWLRYAVMLGLLLVAAAALTGSLPVPGWLAWKLVCFVGVMACGVGIRLCLIDLEPAWGALKQTGSTPELEERVWRGYVRATSVLVLLWVFIAVAVCLSVFKPV